jgi:hypothetical protein
LAFLLSSIPICKADVQLWIPESKDVYPCKQYCGSRSGIRYIFDPWILDEKNPEPDPGSWMNIPELIYENLVSGFWVKNT